MENKMAAPLLGKFDAGATAAALLPEFTRIVERKLNQMKHSLEASLEDGKWAASRAMRQTRNAALDDLDELQYKIKRQPLVAVSAACAVGFAVGLLLPHLFRNRHNE